MKSISFAILTMFLLLNSLQAQEKLSWRKHEDKAAEFQKQGNYADAAYHYEQAYKGKKSKKEFAFNAAEGYYITHNYRKAAEMYQYVRDENSKYPLIGLKYARSLKQDGQYDKAKDAFNQFLASYSGESKSILEDIVRKEVEGCDLAAKLPTSINRDVELKLLDKSVNSDSNEMSPRFVAGDKVYYTSTLKGKAKIMATQWTGTAWGNGFIPTDLPVMGDQHIANGTLSADGQRLYCTICDGSKPYSNNGVRCELFVIRKKGSAWGTPEVLPDYINIKGFTTTQPHVSEQNGMEYLFFVSNRDGGRGGMDIWFASRDLGKDNLEFSFPVNAGPIVNTEGDEITPFYEANNELLYFASNGHVNIGGFDLFKTQGVETNWNTPVNLGLPFNSSADDSGLAYSSSGKAGFFVSNRPFGGVKNNTQHTDLFYFGSQEPSLTLKGNVYDLVTGLPVPGVEVKLMDAGGAEPVLISSNRFAEGMYSFDLNQNITYLVEINKDGYNKASYSFTTDDPQTTTYGRPVYLETFSTSPTPVEVDPTPVNPTPNPKNPTTDTSPTPVVGGDPFVGSVNEASGEFYTAKGQSSDDTYEYTSKAPRLQGTYYKVQLIALAKYQANSPAFAKVKSLGRIDTEFISERSLNRVLVGDFLTQDAAAAALAKAKKQGFPTAFIVKYMDGTRHGSVR